MWKKVLSFTAFVIVALALALFIRARSFDFGTAPPPLAEVRDLPIERADGSKSVLGDAIRPGVPTVINFWASWCGPCFSEAPLISDLQRKFGPEQLNLVYLNVRDPNAGRERLGNFMESFGMDRDGYVILEDKHIGTLTNADNQLIPRTLIYDGDGQPMGTITGYRPLALARIEGLLGE